MLSTAYLNAISSILFDSSKSPPAKKIFLKYISRSKLCLKRQFWLLKVLMILNKSCHSKICKMRYFWGGIWNLSVFGKNVHFIELLKISFWHQSPALMQSISTKNSLSLLVRSSQLIFFTLKVQVSESIWGCSVLNMLDIIYSVWFRKGVLLLCLT